MKKKKTITSKKTYKIELIEYSDNTSTMNRTCDGFNGLELLGLLDIASSDIVAQFSGNSKLPDIVNKKFIKRK